MMDHLFGRKKPEVLVVGAGPVGLYAALALAQRGIRAEVVDRAWRPGAHSYALALHPEALALLDRVGLAEAALEHAYRVDTVAFYDGERRRAELRLADLPTPYPFLAVTRQDVLENLLTRALEQRHAKVLWNHDAAQIFPEADHVAVTVDHLEKESMGYSVAHTEWVVVKSRQEEVAFVVGADGHRSDVRRALGIPFEEVGETQHFAVFEFKTNAKLSHEVRVVMDGGLTSVLWPMPDGHARWSFELPDPWAAPDSRTKDRLTVQLGTQAYPVLDEDHLRRLISERAPWFIGSVDEVEWRVLVRFERRLAPAFGDGRVWLVGDAAHMTGPVGIQSMNVGFREADDLTGVIAAVLRGGAPLERLRAYGEDRQAEWRMLLGLEGGLHAVPGADPWVGARAAQLLPCIPASGDHLALLARQIGLEVQPAGALAEAG